ncbi:MAG TPA: hypothetical protein PKN33_16965 [Phycisphaerae bacterium]|nr:hypothetical protein [Phycisphaerae bacterium]
MFLRKVYVFVFIAIWSPDLPCAFANPTIDQMIVGNYSRTYFPDIEPGLFLIQRPQTYVLNDGTSWSSGAGVGQQFTTRVSEQSVDDDIITFVMDRPVGERIFEWTDYNTGDHQAQGTLISTGPIVLNAVLGSSVATVFGYAQVESNDPTAWGEDEFNYFSASIGEQAPFNLTYTLRNGRVWDANTFATQFNYDIDGVVDFAAAVPEPTTGFAFAFATLLVCLHRRAH